MRTCKERASALQQQASQRASAVCLACGQAEHVQSSITTPAAAAATAMMMTMMMCQV